MLYLMQRFARVMRLGIPNVASMLACGAPVSAIAPNRKRCPSTACRVAGRKDRAARAEAAETMPVDSIQKSPPFFPYVQKRTARRPERSWQGMTRDRKMAAAHVAH